MSYILERCLELRRFHEQSKRVRRGVSVGLALVIVAVVAVVIRVAMPLVEDAQHRRFLRRFLASGHSIDLSLGSRSRVSLRHGLDYAVDAVVRVSPQAIHLNGDAWDHEDDGAIARYFREVESATIAGRVDAALLEALASLPALKSLSLKNATVAGDTAGRFPTFSELRWLELPDNGIGVECLPAVGRMSRLESLRLVTDRLDGESAGHICALINLGALEIARTNLRQCDLTRLAGGLHLNSMNLVRCKIEPGQLDGLAGSRVRSLSLRGTRLDARAVELLGKMTELDALDLSECGLAPSDAGPLLRLRRLTRLDLSLNRDLDDSLAEMFDDRCQLQTLQLQGTRVSRTGLSAILQRVETLERIRASDSAWHVRPRGQRR